MNSRGGVHGENVSLLVCGVGVFEGRVTGDSPLWKVLVYVNVDDPRGGSFLAGVSLINPYVAGGGSVLVLGPAWEVRGVRLGVLRFVGRFSNEVLVGP